MNEQTIHSIYDRELICSEDTRLLQALRSGDERAFLILVERLHGKMMRIALHYVLDRQIAEEVIQDTWMGVLHGLTNFEERSSLQTWIFQILTNRAKTRMRREQRTPSLSDIVEPQEDEPAVSLERFRTGYYAGWWILHPDHWNNGVEDQVLWQETYVYIQRAVQQLPASQRIVITLRDIEGWTASEVCNRLALSEENQRVLLHRARSKVRRALEQYFGIQQQAKQAVS
ncbi:MAG: RNA polymerase sigma factor [Chloroflexi bacterium]|nr:RNA polymerase sigma factor [Chloroflexota bacterium]